MDPTPDNVTNDPTILGDGELKSKQLPQRYVTLDFLRGVSIFGMLVIHLLINITDISWTDRLDTVPVFFIVVLLILIYLGGWRGLFLLISGIGNMIAMQKAVHKGVRLVKVVKKQFIGGILLLIFAMLSESVLGYYGLLGQGILKGNWELQGYLYRTFTQHTIHAIAWSLILNAILYFFIISIVGFARKHVLATIYLVLAVITVAVSNPVWAWHQHLITTFNLNMGQWYNQGIKHAFLCLVVNPLGGTPEPIFPFIAVLFLGNIIGIYLADGHSPRKLPLIGILSGIACIIVGVIVGIQMGAQFEDWLPLFHPERITKINIWIPWFLFMTGGQLILVMFCLRFIEYRQQSTKFAVKTTYFRRFGLLPFTVYTFQWFELLPRALLGWKLNIDILHGEKVSTWIYLLVLGLYLLIWQGIFWIWEKGKYIGSLEWIMGQTINGFSHIFNRSKNKPQNVMKSSKSNLGDLVQHVFWINLSEPGIQDRNRIEKNEHNLLIGCAISSIFLCPFIWINFILLKQSWKKNPKLKTQPIQVKIAAGITLYAFIQFIAVSIFLLTWKGLSF